jgi:hypothetical protein
VISVRLEQSFHQPFGLTVEEETREVLRLERNIVRC